MSDPTAMLLSPFNVINRTAGEIFDWSGILQSNISIGTIFMQEYLHPDKDKCLGIHFPAYLGITMIGFNAFGGTFARKMPFRL